MKKFNEYQLNEDELYDKEKYQKNKKIKIENKVNDFVDQNGIPKDDYEIKEFLLKYSNELLEDFPVDNMLDLIYLLKSSRSLIIELLNSMIQEYKAENRTRSQMSPSYRRTATKIEEIQKIYDMLKGLK